LTIAQSESSPLTESQPKTQRPLTRIQARNRARITDAALEVFSNQGFRGATIDMIATQAGLSKPNLLYYFPSKAAIHTAVLEQQLLVWLDPLRDMNPDGDPLDEVLAYVARKLDLSRSYPRESRLFANEILQGAPRIHDALTGDLKNLVDEKAALIGKWMQAGALQPSHPHHLIFSIWSLTQHYADFDVQLRAVLGDEDPLAAAPEFVETLFRRMLAV
jgi:TetR/AcrR family transcriptional regulator